MLYNFINEFSKTEFEIIKEKWMKVVKSKEYQHSINKKLDDFGNNDNEKSNQNGTHIRFNDEGNDKSVDVNQRQKKKKKSNKNIDKEEIDSKNNDDNNDNEDEKDKQNDNDNQNNNENKNENENSVEDIYSKKLNEYRETLRLLDFNRKVKTISDK